MNIIQFVPCPSPIEKDTLLPKLEPAYERMAQAARQISAWRVKGYRPRVSWAPVIQIVDPLGFPLPHRAGVLPELIWLLREPIGAPASPFVTLPDRCEGGQIA